MFLFFVRSFFPVLLLLIVLCLFLHRWIFTDVLIFSFLFFFPRWTTDHRIIFSSFYVAFFDHLVEFKKSCWEDMSWPPTPNHQKCCIANEGTIILVYKNITLLRKGRNDCMRKRERERERDEGLLSLTPRGKHIREPIKFTSYLLKPDTYFRTFLLRTSQVASKTGASCLLTDWSPNLTDHETPLL